MNARQPTHTLEILDHVAVVLGIADFDERSQIRTMGSWGLRQIPVCDLLLLVVTGTPPLQTKTPEKTEIKFLTTKGETAFNLLKKRFGL